MTNKVLIIDYGVGNIRSVYQSITHLGFDCKVSNSKNEIINADKIIFPGVGAFGSAMRKLNKLDMIEPIIKFKNKGNFILGICLGMQLMMSKSFEFGEHTGLNLIDGEVVNLKSIFKKKCDIPHIGWCTLENIAESKNKIFKNINYLEKYYFIHSYYSKVFDQDIEVFNSIYSDSKFTSMFISNNVIGTQFHPEKSGKSGLKLLYNFLIL
tara:strand:- start:96 stop:725 length:630 start_codon:yes stop_codon:yes gene_type:complete